MAAKKLILGLASEGSPCPSHPYLHTSVLGGLSSWEAGRSFPRSLLPSCHPLLEARPCAEGGMLAGEMLLHCVARSWYHPSPLCPEHHQWEGHGSRGGGESRAPDLESLRASEVEKVSLTGSFRGSESEVLAGGKALINCCSVGLLLDLQSKMLLDWKKCNNSSFA